MIYNYITGLSYGISRVRASLSVDDFFSPPEVFFHSRGVGACPVTTEKLKNTLHKYNSW